MANQSIKNEAFKLVFWQLIAIMGLALILFLLLGIQSGVSALLGGLAYCVPNFVFVWRVFGRTMASARVAKQFLVSFVVGEASKLFVSAILFVLVVNYLPVQVVYVLSGYITAIFAFWVVAFMVMSNPQGGDV